jgi:hypothetical protein
VDYNKVENAFNFVPYKDKRRSIVKQLIIKIF